MRGADGDLRKAPKNKKVARISGGCLGWESALPNNAPSRNLPWSNRRSLALRAGRAYDKNLPFLGAFQSSLGEVDV